MKETLLVLVVALNLGLAMIHAEVPEAVLVQIRTDMRTGLLASDTKLPDERMAPEIQAFEQQTRDPASDVAKAFEFSQAELAAFNSGSPGPTDAELEAAVAEISKMIPTKAFPKLLAYYESLRAAGKLTVKQKILHQRVCRLVTANIKRHLEESDKKP